jgi:hypothetical protein
MAALPNPFIDPTKSDVDRMIAQMLDELNLFVPHVAREIHASRQSDDPAQLLFLRKEFAPIREEIARR